MKNIITHITITCNECGNIENYSSEEEFFQGEMWGVVKDNFTEVGDYIICNNCLTKK